MTDPFPFDLLRPGSPTEPASRVAEVPHRAKLDQNESAVDLPAELKQRILAALGDERWNRYPQPARYQHTKAAFGAAIGQPPERLIITAGGDQLIQLAFWAAGGPGRRARIFEPTYPMFAAFARSTQTPVDSVLLGPDFDVAAHGLGDHVDLLNLVSPNNPTGDGPSRGLIREALARPCLVFVDEAYAEYAGASVIDLVPEHPNLLVGRSLSKSLLAGVRLGFGVGHPDLINVLERLIFAPYNLNVLQLVLAEQYAAIRPHAAAAVNAVIEERERVRARIAALGLRVWPSRANFLLFEVPDAARVNAGLLARGIRLRDVSGMPGLGEHLRVTIGTAEQNELFLDALGEAV